MKSLLIAWFTVAPLLALAQTPTCQTLFSCDAGKYVASAKIVKCIYSDVPELIINDANVANPVHLQPGAVQAIAKRADGNYDSFQTDGEELGYLFRKEGSALDALSQGYRISAAHQTVIFGPYRDSPPTITVTLTGPNYFFHAADCSGNF